MTARTMRPERFVRTHAESLTEPELAELFRQRLLQDPEFSRVLLFSANTRRYAPADLEDAMFLEAQIADARDQIRRSNSLDELLELRRYALEIDAALTARAIGFK